MTSTRFACAAILGALLLSGAARAGDMGSMDMPHRRAAAGETPADRAYAASMRRMMRGMDVRPSGRPDHDFVRMMIPHHRGAIDMARVELRYGRDPALRKLARDIVRAQDGEIALMKTWAARHPVPPDEPGPRRR